ncbi:MAG: ubiquinol-cytochrome c reductase iron-sulfur subunit [Desulfuromonadales bacterium]|nr:ubiquinol-cytochrome c reductase iron-sulfur subunit [Desulfuromonadales bacterium]NIS42438.1 ubiquinol-cytochrome c reductase iron-sulfur subunit [Desulfuromonadales bacterium]
MTRRQWLKTVLIKPAVAATTAVLGGILIDVWLAAGRFSSRHWASVSDLQSLPVEGTVPLPRQRVALICRPGDVSALSLECTHLGCLVNTIDQGFYCPCHGSEFGPRGEVWSGPAPRNLDWLPVRVRGDKVWVQSGNRLQQPVWAGRKA